MNTPPSQRAPVDHVARLVERHFRIVANQLTIDGFSATSLAHRFGTPLFVYSSSAILRQVSQVKESLPAGFELYYSMKANPNARILDVCLDAGCGLEIASGGELHQALESGCSTKEILFAGPGKTDQELAAAIDAGIKEIHLESIDEAKRLDSLAAQRNRTIAVALRINPSTASGGAMRMGGQASPFGIAEENLEEAIATVSTLERLRIEGVHLFMGSQVLDADVLKQQYLRAVELALQVARRLERPLSTIDFGGGLGTPYFSNENPLQWDAVRDALAEAKRQMSEQPLLKNAKGILEPGRFLVSESGIYITKVQQLKSTRGKHYAIVDGGMHHHLAASGNLGQAIKRNYPVAALNRMRSDEHEVYQIAGPLCTPLDTLARNIELPKLQVGDFIGVFQSGAYARTASPHGFLSHASPPEVLTFEDRVELIRRRSQPSDLLRDQCCDSFSKEDSEETWSS